MSESIIDIRMSFKHQLEYGLLLFFVWLVRHLPRSLAYSSLENVTLFAHQIIGWRKQNTKDRISEVCDSLDKKKQTWIRKEAARNLGRSLTELIRPTDTPDVTSEGMEETFDAFRTAREKGKGVLLVILHSGNWDMAGTQTIKEGFPICFIARKQKNKRTYDMLAKVREKNQGMLVDRDDPRLIRKLLGFLAQNGIVVILVDIRARQSGDSYHYLGKKAWLANGLGLLAAKSGAEVVPVHLGRKGRDLHVWKPLPARRLSPGNTNKTARKELLQSCLDDLGAEVLKNPESYFWFNKRWVLQPFGE